jgi:hypothetical protein
MQESQRALRMPRTGSRNNTATSATKNNHATPKAGDLSKFGRINKPTAGIPITFGPTGVFNKSTKESKKHESGLQSRASSMTNPFSLLSQNPETAAEDTGSASETASQPVDGTSSPNPGSDGVSWDAPQPRRKIELLPHSKVPTKSVSESGSSTLPGEQTETSEPAAD